MVKLRETALNIRFILYIAPVPLVILLRWQIAMPTMEKSFVKIFIFYLPDR